MPGRDVAIEADHASPLAGVLDGRGDRGVVLCSHFTGFKEVAHMARLGRALAKAGMCGLRFDYHDCIGESDGACEDMRLTHQVRDTLAAVDHLCDEEGVDSVGLWGHSLGGLTAIVAAASSDRVDALVTVAAPSRPAWDDLFADRAETWKREGHITFPSWKEGEVRIDYGFYQDLRKYDGRETIRDVDVPVLVLHPGDDETVPVQDGRSLHEAARDARLVVLEGADHLLTDRDDEMRMVDLSVAWFDDRLG